MTAVLPRPPDAAWAPEEAAIDPGFLRWFYEPLDMREPARRVVWAGRYAPPRPPSAEVDGRQAVALFARTYTRPAWTPVDAAVFWPIAAAAFVWLVVFVPLAAAIGGTQ